ncbi:MAG: hypothetical protein HC800_19395 [Phormidesmis sp. RL_2_1]|nr:hypothetical protein [Phormidesmis sp. RL_2_1]
MNSNDKTAQMIGQIIEPVTAKPLAAHYRLEKLLSQKTGKRTFLAVNTHSEAKVVVNLVLFGPDFLAETIHPPAIYPLTPASAQRLEIAPYIDSFEVETPLGVGFAMVQPYQPTPHLTLALPQAATLRQCTRTPKMSYSVFKLHITPNKFEIHFPQRRLRENLSSDQSSDFRLSEVELGVLTVLATIILVGGAVAISGSIVLGIAIAALLPFPLQLLASSPQSQPNGKAILQLTQAAPKRARLSLSTLPAKSGKTVSSEHLAPAASQRHMAQVPISTIKLSSAVSFSRHNGLTYYQISFLLNEHNSANCQRLRIVGTYQEIRWLGHHLSQWRQSSQPSHSSQPPQSPQSSQSP